MTKNSTRANIVAAADGLFYRRGFTHTSFTDIAEVVGVSRGNFYFHFKSKDEILDAVIELRLANTAQMLEQWERTGETPIGRIRQFINMLTINQADIKRSGCPVGSLCIELAKLNHASQKEAKKLFTLFRNWLRSQFEALGRKRDADALAMHFLARSQGVATLANALRDDRFIQEEVRQMHAWLDSCVESATVRAANAKPKRVGGHDVRRIS
jgi:TetR/AcrR family transcriptional repressor of nem operon